MSAFLQGRGNVIKFVCQSCGGASFTYSEGAYRCDHCDSCYAPSVVELEGVGRPAYVGGMIVLDAEAAQENHLERASQSLSARRWYEAEEHADKALGIAPHSSKARLFKAQAQGVKRNKARSASKSAWLVSQTRWMRPGKMNASGLQSKSRRRCSSTCILGLRPSSLG